jgi:hypothetical protein
MTQATLDRTTQIILDRREPYSVQYAARAVARDIGHVLGTPANVGSQLPAEGALTIVVDGRGDWAARHGIHSLKVEEDFALRLVQVNGRAVLLIAGGGERGAIYGLYHFARTHLDADPFQHINGYRPARRDHVALDNVNFDSPPQTFQFRGWHLESQGLLLPWRADYSHQNDYWELVCETLLRCGGNMIKPETNRPESVEVGVAQRLGLLITQEHCNSFGIGAWEMRPPVEGFNFVYDDFPEVFQQIWTDGLRRYPRPQRVIWTLGYRGRGDRPFWEAAPERYDTDAKRGACITRALQAQKRIIDEHLGDKAAGFVFNAWMEGNRLLTQGDIKLPDGVLTVWADNGYGTFRSMIAEGCDASQVRYILPDRDTGGTHGTYYHVSMWDYCTPVLTQFIPPARIQDQYTRVLKSRATGYSLVNAGRVCHCVTSAAAVADVWRRPAFWSRPEAPGEAGGQFLAQWCDRHFPTQQQAAITCYEALYTLPIKYGHWAGWDDYVLGDVAYARLGRYLVQMALMPSARAVHEARPPRFFGNEPISLPQMVEMMRSRTSEVLPRWEQARAVAQGAVAQLQGESRRFFINDLLVQIEVNLFYGRHLHELCLAVAAYLGGDLRLAHTHGQLAKQAVLDLARTLAQRDYRPWDRSYNRHKMMRSAAVPLAYQTAQLLTRVIDVMLTRQFAPLEPLEHDDELHWLQALDAMENLEVQ